MNDVCVKCGNPVPEGRQVCVICSGGVRDSGSSEYQGEIKNMKYEEIRPIGKHEDKPQKHLEICTILNDIYARKNHDYGDSFAKLRNELPGAILVRIYDKYSRLKTLLEGADQKVKDESIDDTLMDLANYCIMELVERKMENEN